MWSQSLSVLNPYEALLESNRKSKKELKINRFFFGEKERT